MNYAERAAQAVTKCVGILVGGPLLAVAAVAAVGAAVALAAAILVGLVGAWLVGAVNVARTKKPTADVVPFRGSRG
jgi:hypothetical protein